ncbi:HlyU family transcriptional regulator [Pelagibius sp.]|uniref:HlyU family transcriptional regulator n=1 Tax=Pelagibius sp. TaxID=1931238 RepID=UPI002602B7CB|nr:HlyU family transcriptional regulator [Pelagibius sp.]
MGFLSKLFGGGGGETAAPSAEAIEYKGFQIQPAARRQGGQWLTAGVIRKEVDGEVREHSFLRADTHASQQDADDFALVKGRQIIDEQGDRLFKD